MSWLQIIVLMNENNKIQKAGFKVLAQMDYTSSGVVKPVFVFFDVNKEEIIHNSDNILKVLKKETIDVKASREILARTVKGLHADVFLKIFPILGRILNYQWVFFYTHPQIQKVAIAAIQHATQGTLHNYTMQNKL